MYDLPQWTFLTRSAKKKHLECIVDLYYLSELAELHSSYFCLYLFKDSRCFSACLSSPRSLSRKKQKPQDSLFYDFLWFLFFTFLFNRLRRCAVVPLVCQVSCCSRSFQWCKLVPSFLDTFIFSEESPEGLITQCRTFQDVFYLIALHFKEE